MSRILQEVGFIHLHVHSAFSLLEGALPIATLAKLAKADNQPALALTDTNNLFGALEFAEKMAGSGIQPIAGIQLAVAFGEAEPNRLGKPEIFPSVVLLAANSTGYDNLLRLGSHAFLGGDATQMPHVPWPMLADHGEGLLVLTGGPNGPLDRAIREGKAPIANQYLDDMARVFDQRLYIEIQRHGLESERAVEPQLLDMAYRKGLPLVATNEAYFAKADDFEAHDALVAIAEGRLVSDDNRRRLTPDHGFKSRREMQALFADVPEAMANSVEIAMPLCISPEKTRADFAAIYQGNRDRRGVGGG